ncbi:DNA repair protein RecO [Neptuniibacter sp. CAU 1671]|uniref:DNA repair protein RecO n=1 Tax=Neptuniibacter sp. CAU 1671 TaxID=3032593 RepID=UPI0023D9E76E|nr:DNA repair protein RecO [Neptuniibacter sp. CAU 1671]MDF2183040.1 DNA repair protein RecO [Neptuniibacter sp. CAU 1671]
MAERFEQHAAYVLHSRPYRDTSLLVDFFTLEQGRVSAVVQGARRPGSRLRSILQPFVPIQIRWRGRQELKTLQQAEAVGTMMLLQGNALLCALYVNELLQRLLQPFDAHPRLYVYYQYVLNELLSGSDVEGGLRTFEHRLLHELGCLPALDTLDAAQLYQFHPEQGFLLATHPAEQDKPACFWGQHLQSIAVDDYAEPDVKRAAKRLMRLAIDHQLGGTPLRSRSLFKKM